MSLIHVISTLTNLELEHLVAAIMLFLASVGVIMGAVLILERRFTSRSPKQRRDIIALIGAWRRSG